MQKRGFALTCEGGTRLGEGYHRLWTFSRPEPVRQIWALQSADNSGLDEGACLTVKNIGKPCAGKPHARFDEGGLAGAVKVRLLRHRQTKGAETDRQHLQPFEPALYSTPDHRSRQIYPLLDWRMVLELKLGVKSAISYY